MNRTPPDAMDHPVVAVGSLKLSPEAKALVNQVLDSNRLSYGIMTQRFEREFAALHDCRFGVMSNSGTSALHIAVAAGRDLHGWNPGDEIIVPALTFVATANVVLHNGLVPVLVDVDPQYYELDPALLEAKITPRTRAIIPVHLFGQPCDMDPILEIARRHGLLVIEDSCETMFAKYKGRSAGSLGDIACFSTYVAHLLVTGVGGLNTTNNPEYAVILRSLMNHGRDSIYLSIDDDDNKSDAEMKMIIERRFRFIHVGHSFRCTELEAAIGLGQLGGWSPMIARRRENARFLSRALARFEDRLQLPAVRDATDHSFMMYPIVLRDQPKASLVNFLERYGVETRDMLPLTNQPVYHRLMKIDESAYPVAQWINNSGFYIGCHQDLEPSDLAYVVELFERFWSRTVSAKAETLLVLVATGDVSALDHVLDTVPLQAFRKTVVIVEDGGTTPIGERARAAGLEVVRGGREDPFTVAREYAAREAVEHAVVFVADGRFDPACVMKLLVALEAGADMAVASRFMPGGGRTDQTRRLPYRSLGNRAFTLAANLAFFGNVTDSLSPCRGIKVRHLPRSGTLSGLRGLYDLSIRAAQEHWRVTEVPVTEQVPPPAADLRRAWLSAAPLAVSLFRHYRNARTSRRQGRR